MSPKKLASMYMGNARGICRNFFRRRYCLIQLPTIALFCVVSALAQTKTSGQPPAQSKTSPPVPAKASSTPDNASPNLLAIKRICVAKLSGDEKFAEQVQDMLISSLFVSKRLVVTENCDHADATLKGAATQMNERTSRLESEGIGFGEVAGAVHGSGGNVSGGVAGVSGASGETLASSTVKNLANLAIRLVNPDGDVIWATTQESTGSKMKGPAADLADRAVRQLIRDIEKAEAVPKPSTY